MLQLGIRQISKGPPSVASENGRVIPLLELLGAVGTQPSFGGAWWWVVADPPITRAVPRSRDQTGKKHRKHHQAPHTEESCSIRDRHLARGASNPPSYRAFSFRPCQ